EALMNGPELVRRTGCRCLHDIGLLRICGGIHHQAAVLVGDDETTAGTGHQPMLVVSSVEGPLNQLGTGSSVEPRIVEDEAVAVIGDGVIAVAHRSKRP